MSVENLKKVFELFVAFEQLSTEHIIEHVRDLGDGYYNEDYIFKFENGVDVWCSEDIRLRDDETYDSDFNIWLNNSTDENEWDYDMIEIAKIMETHCLKWGMK